MKLGKVLWIGWIKSPNTIMIKIAILRPQALRALPRITNTEITLASSTSIGSGSTQIFTPGSWVLNNNRLQNCITLEDTVMRPRCASWTTGTTVWTHPAAGLHRPHRGNGDHDAQGQDQPFVGHQILAANKSACSYAPGQRYCDDYTTLEGPSTFTLWEFRC